MKNKVISLYDFTGVAVTPWAKAGYECFCFDIQHDKPPRTKNIRSATPRGFAQAVFESNSKQRVELDFTSLELALEETGGNKA